MKTQFLSYLLLLPLFSIGQASLALNAWADIEASQGGANSHFYYNQIHADYQDWRVGLSELNILAEAKFTPALSLNLRGQLLRKTGAKLEQLWMPLANIKYAPEKQPWSLTLGRFITPFGSFTEKQHSKDRLFINVPLAFGYYTNVSPKVGFMEGMGEEKFQVDGAVEWGSTMLYYGGYSNGLRFDWSAIPDKMDISLALTNGAPNGLVDPFDFSNWGVIGKIKFQPTYYWEQRVSFSHGTFLQSSEHDGLFNTPFQQTLVGTDIVVGTGFWEFTGEVVAAVYDTEKYLPYYFDDSNGPLRLSSGAFSASVKYEFPFLSGLYAAYGIEQLVFSDFEDIGLYSTEKWDDKVLRHNFGLGYKITDFLLLRTNYMLQKVDNHPAWEQNTWRTVLTVYY